MADFKRAYTDIDTKTFFSTRCDTFILKGMNRHRKLLWCSVNGTSIRPMCGHAGSFHAAVMLCMRRLTTVSASRPEEGEGVMTRETWKRVYGVQNLGGIGFQPPLPSLAAQRFLNRATFVRKEQCSTRSEKDDKHILKNVQEGHRALFYADSFRS